MDAPGAVRPRVVVSGVGVVCAAGVGIGPAWERLRADPPAAAPFRGQPPLDHVTFPAFQVPEYDLEELGIPRARLRWLRDEGLSEARDLRHLLAATRLALSDAGLEGHLAGLEPPVAAVVADESPGFSQLCGALFQAAGNGANGARPEDLYSALVGDFFQLNTFLLPYYLARVFGFEGYSLFVNSACSSGLNAVDVAAQQLVTGRSRIAVVAAAENPLSVPKFFWFRDLGLYAGDGTLRPFDAHQQGTVFGDGGAALVLERLDSARQRGARIYAEYLGSGFAQDGWKIAVPSPVKGQAEKALRRALQEAGVEPGDVDVVVPHGAGCPASDQYEAMVLNRVFGDAGAWPAVTALKPMLGHNLGGSALIELAFLLAAMERGQVPPTLGHRTALLRYPVPLVEDWVERSLRVAVKLTVGFAGYYAAAVFQRE